MTTSAEATCLRCYGTLRRTRPDSFNWALALSTTAFVLYFIAVLAPFLSVDIVGQVRQTTMLSLPQAFWDQGQWELAIIVTLTAIIAPLAKIAVVFTVLLGLRTENPPWFLPVLFKWYRRIGPWAMVEVFLLGVLVAFTRLGSIATVSVDTALYAVAALMLAMVGTDYYLDPDEVWEMMEARGLVPPPLSPDAGQRIGCDVCDRVHYGQEGDRCNCCGSVVRTRRRNAVANTWALLGASVLLYIPANVYPVLTITRLGRAAPATILGGAKELLEAGMWPLALLVFVASLMVPLLKLVSLMVMLVATHRGSAWRLHDRTTLYRVIDFIGRWSMIDVFMVATLTGLVRAGAIATVDPNLGAVCFASVVVLTMVAVACFDPRVMWDAAEARERAAPAASTRPQARPISSPAEPRAV